MFEYIIKVNISYFEGNGCSEFVTGIEDFVHVDWGGRAIFWRMHIVDVPLYVRCFGEGKIERWGAEDKWGWLATCVDGKVAIFYRVVPLEYRQQHDLTKVHTNPLSCIKQRQIHWNQQS